MNRILLISPQPFFQWRGSPIRVKFIVQALSELGYQIDLLCLPFGDDVDINNVHIVRAPNLLGIKDVSIGPSLAKAFYDVLLFFIAGGRLLRHPYAAIHGIEEAGAIAVVLGRVFRKPVIFERHSDPSSYRKSGLKNLVLSAYSAVERFSARHANVLIATGPGLGEQLKSMAGVTAPLHVIQDIPSSLVEATPSAVEQRRASLAEQANQVLVLYVGSFAVYQGIELLFNTIPLVLNESSNTRMVIVGGNQDEIDRYRARLADAGLDQRVHFVGKIDPDQLPATLAAADILLVPRQTGVNTPLKVLDYFKSGRAIVATDVPANRLLLNESNACLCKPDARSFADGILQLAADEDRRRTLGAVGYALYQKKYNYTVFKQQLFTAYRDLNLNN